MKAHALVAVLGPTASGKSSLAVWLAERLNGEVVTCDSTQVHRGFDVGTAKPAADERRDIPHHMMDLVEPGEVFTAGDYRRRAEEVLQELVRRSKLPILTVGTGLYFRALVEGLADAPTRCEELRARLHSRGKKRGAAYLHRLLARLDARAAQRIAPQDEPKIIRAIEVRLLAGRPISELHAAGRQALAGFGVIKVGLLPQRAELYRRIEQRVERMLEAGWVAEVERLLAGGLTGSEKPFQFIGYGELRDHLRGGKNLEEARRAIQQATRRYAKRQITWFRKEADVRWLAGFGDDPVVASAALGYLEEQLSMSGACGAASGEGV